SVYLWKRGAKEATKLGAHRGRVNTITFGKNGRSLVTAGADGTAKVFGLEDGSVKSLGKEGGARVRTAMLSDDREPVVTVVGKTAQVWRRPARARAPASGREARGCLRRSSSVELSDDRLRELLAPAAPAGYGSMPRAPAQDAPAD